MNKQELTERQEWFRSMFDCPNCKTEKFNYGLCPFHEQGKRLLGIEKKVDELVAARIYKGDLGGVLRYDSGKEDEVSRQYIHEQLGTRTLLKIVKADGEWVEL